MSKFIVLFNQKVDNQRGLIFPYFLFLITVILIVISGSTAIYQNNISITKYHEEQLKIETLFQTGSTQFSREETADLTPPGKTVYTYPYGKVTIEYSIAEDVLILHYLINTDENATYQTEKRLSLKNF